MTLEREEQEEDTWRNALHFGGINGGAPRGFRKETRPERRALVSKIHRKKRVSSSERGEQALAIKLNALPAQTRDP